MHILLHLREGATRCGAFLLFLFACAGLPACALQDDGQGAGTASLGASGAAGAAGVPGTADTPPLPKVTASGASATSSAPAKETSARTTYPMRPTLTDGTGPVAKNTSGVIGPEWQHLRSRLAADGLSGPAVDRLLASLGPKSSSPMGRKMLELYKKSFLPRPAPPKKPAEDVYKGVVTAANADKCLAFMTLHKQAFAAAEKTYGVPPSVACALLFVETRLGEYLGGTGDNALQTLASMAESTQKADITDWLGKMPGHEKHNAWFASTMPKRAEWAYKETRALVRYMVDNHIEPETLPGSIYGAVGLCQFMPSNIDAYGADGNNDGIIDLYTPEDAIASLAKYLSRHGWNRENTRENRHKVLMRYNKSTRYANTILALSELTEQRAAQQR